METGGHREPQGTPEDREQGTPQRQLLNEEPSPEEGDERPQGDVGAPQEGAPTRRPTRSAKAGKPATTDYLDAATWRSTSRRRSRLCARARR
jgi:hypothetical protein